MSGRQMLEAAFQAHEVGRRGKCEGNSKSVKIKRTAYWLLSFTSHFSLDAHTSGTGNHAGEKASGGSEEEDRLLAFAKGICLKWACGRESVFKPRHQRHLFALTIPLPLPLHIFTLKCVQIIQAPGTITLSIAFIKLCAIHKRRAMKLINGQVHWNLHYINFFLNIFNKKSINANS